MAAIKLLLTAMVYAWLCHERSLACAAESQWLDADPRTALPSTQYIEKIPTPEQFFGGDFRIGKRPLFHHELLAYLDELVRLSPRIRSYEYARSHGGRPLRYYIITHPVHHRRLDAIQRQRQAWCDPLDSSAVRPHPPLVVVLAYSIHGNEASGANAAPLVAYHLVAGRGGEVRQMLDRCIILLDPCLNPDGYDRFVSWVSQFRGAIPSPDFLAKEHRESWPGGRTNYYWFDLNRDWLPAVHPESQGRLREFHRWKPNLLFDFHEMSNPATFFLQPGVPTRKNPLIPEKNVSLTEEISRFPGRLLDEAGAPYFTEDIFDDFYPGKGSTYIDFQGGVGILFEQGTTRGALRHTELGTITFAFTVRNQVLASVGALRAALSLEQKLVEYQRQFFISSLVEASNDNTQSYILTSGGNTRRILEFMELLKHHNITFHRPRSDIVLDGVEYGREDTVIVPVRQPQYRLLKSLIERRTEFEENVFYDVSTWCMVDAYGLKMAVSDRPWQALVEPPRDESRTQTEPAGGERRSAVSLDADARYAIVDWRPYWAPRTLWRLHEEGLVVLAASRPFAVEMGGAPSVFPAGTLVVPYRLSDRKEHGLARVVEAALEQDDARVTWTATAFTPQGPDFGSRDFVVLKRPQILMLVGQGVQATSAGEIWHLLDRRFGIPVTLVDVVDADQIGWDNYNVLVLPAGQYPLLSTQSAQRMRSWVERGGTLVAIGTACRWLSDAKWVPVTLRAVRELPSHLPYAQVAQTVAESALSGAILQVEADTTHPITFGLQFPLALLRNHSLVMGSEGPSYERPLRYAELPRLSGYVPPAILRQLPGTPAVRLHRLGAGRIVLLLDPPAFRGHWYGSDRLFLNAVFFGSLLDAPARSEEGQAAAFDSE